MNTVILREVAEISSDREEIRGVARIERKNGCILKVSLINLPPSGGRYMIRYEADGHRADNALTSAEGGTFFLGDIPDDGGVLVYLDDEKSKTPVLYGAFSKYAPDKESMAGECCAGQYDDEIVATENYYGFTDPVSAVGGNNEISSPVFGNNNNHEEKVGYDKSDGNETLLFKASENGVEAQEDGGNESRADENGGGGEPYYTKIKSDLKELFEKHPREYGLESVVAESKWVKVGDGDKHYVVGVIYDKNEPSWICYGVPGRYGERPEEIKNYCSFIPSSLFDLKGVGYWVMYQNAQSGETA
ncbi:MAG: hypothetical protein IJS67_01395 [Clostridia bacterium]|nr:hypothetical protein [Clostridia bacterium]